MKTIFFSLIFSMIGVIMYSQVPQSFNYQAIARDGLGNPIVNSTIKVKLSVLTDTTGFYASGGGTYVWEEEQTNIKTNAFGMFTVTFGKSSAVKIQGSAASFSAIDWAKTPLYFGTKIANPTTYKNMGTAPLLSVPYSMVSDSSKALLKGSKLSVVSSDDASTSALFEVKRKDGQTVFAVYPDAVNIYVPKTTKGVKGGFAIGGFDGSKVTPQDYFRVTPDSVRVYIRNAPLSGKGATKGGFAIGGYDGSKGILPDYFMNITGASTVNTVDSASQILWYPNKQAFLAGRITIAGVDSVGTNSTSLGYKSRAIGNYSQAFGYKTTARGDYSTAIGQQAVAGARSGGVSTASNAFAFGKNANAWGNDSYAFGSGAIASGYRSFAMGSVGLDDSGNPTSTPTTANKDYTFAIGMGAQATQRGAMALGIGATSSGYYSNSFGYYSASSGYYSTALGFRSIATNYYAGAFGFYAKADGIGSMALGRNSWAVSNYSTAVGDSSKTQADYASAFGRMAKAKGTSSVAVGYNAQTLAADAGAFGKNSVAGGSASIAIGNGASTGAIAADAGSFGKLASATGISSLALGTSAIASGTTSVAMGYNAQAIGDYSFAIGTYGLDVSGNPNTSRPTKTAQPYSVAMGMGAQTSLKGDMAFGVNATASGGYSTAIGYSPTSSGGYSSSVGYYSSSAGQYSDAMGYYSAASGNYSTAIGMSAQASGDYSTAMGYSAQASGNKSLSIGSYYSYTYYRFLYNPVTRKFTIVPVNITKNNTATDDYSVALGNGNTSAKGGTSLGSNNYARAMGAVALGHSNYADSIYSFAAGYGNYALGQNAFALGESIYSRAKNCFAVGSYNIDEGDPDTWVDTDPIFIVGNGTSSGRADALKVLKNGTLVLPSLTAQIGTASWLFIDANGNVMKNSSSIRYKTDINPISDVSWFYNLNPVSFVFKSDPLKAVQSGLIAEEVEKVNSQYVLYEKGIPEGVNYPALIAPMIKAIQDQKKTIEELKSENEMLKERLDKLESAFSTLVPGLK